MTAGCETAGGIRNGRGALELGKHRKTLTQTNENPKKSVSRSHEQVRIIDSKTGRKSTHKSTKNRPKTSENRRKIDFGSLWALWVVPRRFLFLVEQRKKASGRQFGSSWAPSWPSWLPCWPSWAPCWQPGTAQTAPGSVPEAFSNAGVSSNGVRIDFSSLFGTIVGSPNLNFRQPVQCFVHFARN